MTVPGFPYKTFTARPGLPVRRNAARGQVVMESIVSIIIFTIMLSLIMSISLYLYVQQALVTTAREGARQASLNADLGSTTTQGTGINYVTSYVKTEFQQLTGQAYDPTMATITVTPPSASANQTPGYRTVTVSINWKMKNPIGIANMLNAMKIDGSAFDKIPCYATATMRYEE
jgi:hypothetical protein